MDFARGIAELADAVIGTRTLTLDVTDHAHVTEVCLMLAAGVTGPVPSTTLDTKVAIL
jgi:hypothetical protein